MTDLEKALIAKVQELDKEARNAEDYYKWWQEEKARANKLESQLLEIAQSKNIEREPITDSAGKGVL